MILRNINDNISMIFSDNWKSFDQIKSGKIKNFVSSNRYYIIFPWDVVPRENIGFVVSCRSGRLPKLEITTFGHLHSVDRCIDFCFAGKSLS